jgi:hypothetical protein
MFDKIARAVLVLAHVLLVVAAILLIIGHNPDSFGTNYQAETLANYAYAFLWIGFGVILIHRLVRIKPKK